MNNSITTAQRKQMVIDGIIVDQLDGLYSLNDLHRAAGGENRHRPSLFLDNRQTKELAQEISKAGFPALRTIKGTAKSGTYASREIVLSYAMWISPAFNLKVLRFFLDRIDKQPTKEERMIAIASRYLRNVSQVQDGMITALSQAYDRIMLPLVSMGAPIKQNAGIDMSLGRYVKSRAKELGIPVHKYPCICDDRVARDAASYENKYAITINDLVDEWIKERFIPYFYRDGQFEVIPYVLARFKQAKLLNGKYKPIKEAEAIAFKKQAIELDKRKALS